MREDAVGMFWQNLSEPRGKNQAPRVLPPTPDTGWRPPKDFPNLVAAARIAVDCETKDVDLRAHGPGVRRGAHIIGLAVGVEDARWYFPMRHEVGSEWNMDPDTVMRWAGDALSGKQDKVGANLLYDADFLAEAGVQLGGRWLDVQIAEPLLDENRFTYALDVLDKDYGGEGKVDDELEKWVYRAYRNKNYREELWRTSPLLVGPYAEGDVTAPLRIIDKQLAALNAQDLTELFEIETDLLPMLLAMRRLGVRVDMQARQQLDDTLTVSLREADARLRAAAGFDVNVNSSADLARMFDALGLDYPRTAKRGDPSFTKGWLEHHPHDIAKLVVDARKLSKLQATFVRGYFDLAVNGRIHALFHPLRTDENGAVSGRFASSNPNLQNIPARDEVWSALIRKLFIPEDDCEWVRHDWSQIEYRFLAHFGIGTNAREVRRLYNVDPRTDFHRMVLELLGWGPEKRKPAKTVNFGLVYGMGPPTLAAQLGMTLEDATRDIFEPYHERVPFVKETYDYAGNRAAARGYVKTILGRRARFDWWQPRNWSDAAEADAVYDGEDRAAELTLARARARWGDIKLRRAFTHKALNRVLQGSAADLMKKAMRDIWRSGVYRVLPVAHLTVHDELDHSVPRTKEAAEAVKEVRRLMEHAIALRVPVIADEERGPNWGECK